MHAWRKLLALSVAASSIGCASARPSVQAVPPCREDWSLEQDRQALAVWAFQADGQATRYTDLYARVDYLQAYCESVNAALGVRPEKAPRWWRWWGY